MVFLQTYMDPELVRYFIDHKSEFFWQVYVPIMVWLVLVLIFLILLFIRYTFGNWTPENPNPYQGETFGMPRGTFRGILTMTLLFVVVILELVNVRVVGFEEEMHYLMAAFQMMIAFYFGSKVMHHITSVDKQKALAEAGRYPQPPEYPMGATTNVEEVGELTQEIQDNGQAVG